MKLNRTQLKLFEKLIQEITQNKIDIDCMDKLVVLPLFQTWKNILMSICKIKPNIKIHDQDETIEDHLQDLILEFTTEHTGKFNAKFLEKLVGNLVNYLTNEQGKMLYYFSPLYNFEFDGDELTIDRYIKIRRISESEMNYLMNLYEGFSPIKISLPKIKHILVIRIEFGISSPPVRVAEKISETLNKFRLLKTGSITSGGLYNFSKSENWNPKNKFDRISYEPFGVISKNKYLMKRTNTKKLLILFDKINNRYPAPKENMTESDFKGKEIYLDKYNDYFDKAICRFSDGLSRNDQSLKIVDFILALEILLVSSPGDNTMKISQRTSLFIGKNDTEKLEIWQHMISFYNFRSGQVHEFTDRVMRVGSRQITKNEATKKLENWTRRSILQMIFFSQGKTASELNKKMLCRKIDESMFSKSLCLQFSKLSDDISNLLDF